MTSISRPSRARATEEGSLTGRRRAALALVAGAGLVAAFLAGLLPVRLDSTPYPRGFYQAATGADYRLTAGPAALSVTGPDSLCLMFWDQEDPPRAREVIELRGQSCSNGSFGDLDWTARYAAARTDEVQLAGPEAAITLVRTQER